MQLTIRRFCEGDQCFDGAYAFESKRQFELTRNLLAFVTVQKFHESRSECVNVRCTDTFFGMNEYGFETLDAFQFNLEQRTYKKN